jgi:hypothetical protein
MPVVQHRFSLWNGASSRSPRQPWPAGTPISYRLAAVPNTVQVALEAGNSPQMTFGHYRELVRAMDAEKWFGINAWDGGGGKNAPRDGARWARSWRYRKERRRETCLCPTGNRPKWA